MAAAKEKLPTADTVAAFFYGTLMHPSILTRVIGNDGSHLQISPAVLLGYTRHRVKYADYPGILPYSESSSLFQRDLNDEEKSVRGSLVTGLTKDDMYLLDVFEGNEYTLKSVHVHALAPPAPLLLLAQSQTDLLPENPPPLGPVASLAAPAKAETYIYNNILDLERELWSFDEFVKKHAWKWVGSESDEMTEVDRRRNAV